MSKKIGLLVLISCLMLGLGFTEEVQAKDSVTIVTQAWPPYVMKDQSGQPTGFDYEVTEAVFQRLGIEFNFKFYPWKRCVNLVKNKQVDGILDISLNDTRQKFMYFPEENLSMSSSVLFYERGSFPADKEFATNEDGLILLKEMEGYTIGYTMGYDYGKAFETSKLFDRQTAESDKHNFRKLLGGRIDLFLINKNNGLYKAKQMGILGEIDYIEEPFSGGPVYLAFSKRKGNQKLAQKFSQELKEFKQTNQYEQILAKYGQKIN